MLFQYHITWTSLQVAVENFLRSSYSTEYQQLPTIELSMWKFTSQLIKVEKHFSLETLEKNIDWKTLQRKINVLEFKFENELL